MFLTIMLFLARGIIAGVFQAAYVYTPEVKSALYRYILLCLEELVYIIGNSQDPTFIGMYQSAVFYTFSSTLSDCHYGDPLLAASVNYRQKTNST
jgi:hypothetical protein